MSDSGSGSGRKPRLFDRPECKRARAVRGAMQRMYGKIRNMDEVIAELIEFWKTHSEGLKREKAITE